MRPVLGVALMFAIWGASLVAFTHWRVGGHEAVQTAPDYELAVNLALVESGIAAHCLELSHRLVEQCLLQEAHLDAVNESLRAQYDVLKQRCR